MHPRELIKGRGRTLLGFVVGAALLWFATRNVPLEALTTSLRRIDLVTLTLVAGLTLLQQGLRTWRQVVLLEPIAPGIAVRRQLVVFMLGFLGIATLPARLGELVRPLMLQRTEGVPISRSLGFVVAERMLDVIVLLGALAITLSRADTSSAAGEIALGARPFTLLALPLAVFGLVVTIWWGHALTRSWLAPAGSAPGKIRAAASQFVASLAVLRDVRRLLLGLVLTVAHFAAMAYSVAFVADALGLGATLGPLECLGILCLTMIGLALPAPPGQIGVFEGSLVAALAVFGVGSGLAPVALAFALVVHWWPLAVHAVATAFVMALAHESTSGLVGELRQASGPDRTRPDDQPGPAPGVGDEVS